MTDQAIAELLAQLASPAPGAAWKAFLQQYSATLRRIVRHYEHDSQRADECFTHVTHALSDDHFRRLRSFHPDGPAKFGTWLRAVTSNLCIDWRRARRGRYRPPRTVAQRPELEQLVFRDLYVRGLSRLQCLRTLETTYPDLNEQTLGEINARLFAILTPQQRWQFGTRASPAGRPSADRIRSFEDELLYIEDETAGPEDAAQTEQQHARLETALRQLSAPQRLLLRLRFEQDLTLAEVSRLTGLDDPFRARRQIDSALAALTELLNGGPSDRKSR